jgi:hypothetical protein
MLILFPDERWCESLENVEYVQAVIEPSEPILRHDQKYEGHRVNLYGSVLKTDRGYEMYYQCGPAIYVGYAHSDDGVSWEKPMINPADFSKGLHQIVQANSDMPADSVTEPGEGDVMTNLVTGAHMPSMIYEPGSDRPYKMFAFGQGGYRALDSKDGRHDFSYVERPVIPLMAYRNWHTGKTWYSDVAPCFKDGNAYVAMTKTYVIDSEQRTRRCVGLSRSDDFNHWRSAETVWVPGETEDTIARKRGFEWADFYGLCPFRYGNGYLGFVWLFEIESELPSGTNIGKMEVFLAYSPDLENWSYVSEEPFIPWDLNFGESGALVTTASQPLFDGDEIKVYYSDNNYPHGHAEKDYTKFKKREKNPTFVIRMHSLKKERLVGVRSELGKIVLRPVSMYGKKLRLNADALKGSITINYRHAGKLLRSETVKGIDATDIIIDPQLAYDISLELVLNDATIYAVETVPS